MVQRQSRFVCFGSLASTRSGLPFTNPSNSLLPKDASKFRSLDSNIKKNTAFIKKCKTSLQADYQTQLLNDINKLSLEKYISEIVGAVIDGMAKCKTSSDVTSCVEVSVFSFGLPVLISQN
jgi:regulator of nonsense transcripts 2